MNEPMTFTQRYDEMLAVEGDIGLPGDDVSNEIRSLFQAADVVAHQLAGMELTTMQRPQKDQILVINTPDTLTDDSLDAIKRTLAALDWYEGQSVVVLEAGLTLKVIDPKPEGR